MTPAWKALEGSGAASLSLASSPSGLSPAGGSLVKVIEQYLGGCYWPLGGESSEGSVEIGTSGCRNSALGIPG